MHYRFNSGWVVFFQRFVFSAVVAMAVVLVYCSAEASTPKDYERVRSVIAGARDAETRLDFDDSGTILGCYIGKDIYHGFVTRRMYPTDDLNLAGIELFSYSSSQHSVIPLPGAAVCFLLGTAGVFALQRTRATALRY